MLVKDLSCYTAGDPVHEGMAFLRDAGWHSDHDMELAARFRRAGFVICGRTNTPELGILPTTEPAAYGADAQPVGHRALAGRLERRLGRGCRRRHGRRSRTPTTAAARSGSPRRTAGSSASSRRAGASPWPRTSGT